MRLILVRHGQTDENTKGIIQDPEVALDEKGRLQAGLVAKKLQSEKINLAYISDFKRTTDTAAEILKFHPETKEIFTPELREKDAGVFVGRPQEDQKRARETSGQTFYDFRPEGGESLVDLQKRIVAFYEKINRSHQNDTVLFVTHNGTIKTLMLHLTGKTFADWETINVANTAVTVIEVNPEGQLEIKVSNDAEHLVEADILP